MKDDGGGGGGGNDGGGMKDDGGGGGGGGSNIEGDATDLASPIDGANFSTFLSEDAPPLYVLNLLLFLIFFTLILFVFTFLFFMTEIKEIYEILYILHIKYFTFLYVLPIYHKKPIIPLPSPITKPPPRSIMISFIKYKILSTKA